MGHTTPVGLARAAAAGLAALLTVLVAHGALPGMVNNRFGVGFLTEGAVRCMQQLGLDALTSWCHAVAEPVGFPLLTGGPLIALGTLLAHIPGIGPDDAVMLASALFDALALAGGYGLLRCLGAGRGIAIAGATAYLLTPTVVGLAPFGGTFVGYTLLPAYILVDLWAMERLEHGAGRRLVAVCLAFALVKTGALFLDGYSFVVSCLFSALLWLDWARRGRTLPAVRRAGGLALLGAGVGLALAAYALYVPGSFNHSRLAVFRSLGADIVTFVVPSEQGWAARLLGFGANHENLWGDGTNAAFNYVGFGCLGLALALLLRRGADSRVLAIAAAGAIAAVLSLGPALKVGAERPAAVAAGSAASYAMPAERELPWGRGFTHVPGVKSMRATYRWFGATRLALVLLAALSVAALLALPGRRRYIGVAVAVLAVIELAPDLPRLAGEHRDDRRLMQRLAREVGADLRATTRAGERAFILDLDAGHNDWLANYLAPAARLRLYNVGGDKNLALARAAWPDEVTALAGSAVTGQQVASGLSHGRVDVVIAPYFSLRDSSFRWPPPPALQTRARTAFAPLLRDPRLRVRRGRWLAAIRLAGATPARPKP